MEDVQPEGEVAEQDVALLAFQEIRDEPPLVIVAGEAVTETLGPGAETVTSTSLVTVPPLVVSQEMA